MSRSALPPPFPIYYRWTYSETAQSLSSFKLRSRLPEIVKPTTKLFTGLSSRAPQLAHRCQLAVLGVDAFQDQQHKRTGPCRSISESCITKQSNEYPGYYFPSSLAFPVVCESHKWVRFMITSQRSFYILTSETMS